MARVQVKDSTTEVSGSYETTIVDLMKSGVKTQRPQKTIRFVSHPFARAVKECGTAHIYTDTADQEEMRDLLVQKEESDFIYMYGEVDGNTTNQPLVVKVLDRFLAGDESDNAVAWIKTLQKERPDLSIEEAIVVIYSIINGRLGREVLAGYAGDRTWQISLELHTALASDMSASKRMGWCLNRAVPNSFVKVAFTPDHPHAFLIARDLENQGIPVNFTATFSARQIVAAALLANPHRTNVFLGRLSQGLESELLGEQVLLQTQRYVRRLREEFAVQTLNMGASVRKWQTLVLTAGCDVYTVPYPVLKEFFTQTLIEQPEISNCLETDYSDKLGITENVIKKVGLEKIKQLYRVEPEFIRFLAELRGSAEYATIDEDGLLKRFDEAGFGDFFYSPTASEWRELRKGKLPDLDSPLTKALPLDTLYTLLAIGDFTNFQDRMDEKIREPIQHLFV